MFKTLKTIAGVACAAAIVLTATSAGAVTVTPFDTPLSPGDSTNGGATAAAFEDFGMTVLSTQASDLLEADVSFTINPFRTDLSGNPANSIEIGYSINGGPVINLPILEVVIPTGMIGAGGVAVNLEAGDVLTFLITGIAGQSGNLVTFAIETSEIPIPAALPLFAAGLAGFGFAARRKKRAV